MGIVPARPEEGEMGDKTRGLYTKFRIERVDGSSEPGGKHDGCYYFVLDTHHDPYAKAAIEAYAESCRDEYPLLAQDILMNIADGSWPFGRPDAEK